jgi:hypothetical protein
MRPEGDLADLLREAVEEVAGERSASASSMALGASSTGSRTTSDGCERTCSSFTSIRPESPVVFTAALF